MMTLHHTPDPFTEHSRDITFLNTDRGRYCFNFGIPMGFVFTKQHDARLRNIV